MLTATNLAGFMGRRRDQVPSIHILLTTLGAGQWQVPANWNSADNEVWCIGGGASGGNGGGGSGAMIARAANLALTPSAMIDYSVGNGGAATTASNGNAGGDSWFGNAVAASAPVWA